AQDPEEIGAASHDYLFYSGYVVLAYWWARSVAAATASSHAESFKQAKLETARFYFARVLPRTLAHAAAIESGAAPLMAMAAERFGD
ncbi:MAG TPA: acyl-CoA dehydrogenase C-terminal domain-containing protein, partial [Pseudoxanthomonas sp.]|nr:acyl-CoA dehydrogenase C-terminal domain-containing protein [Pseudoxanthomonas sp.]